MNESDLSEFFVSCTGEIYCIIQSATQGRVLYKVTGIFEHFNEIDFIVNKIS